MWAGMQINNTILRAITHQINQSNGIWAILMANEYLEKKDPLRLHLVSKAKCSGALDAETCGGAAHLVSEGATLKELSYEDRMTFRGSGASPVTTRRKVASFTGAGYKRAFERRSVPIAIRRRARPKINELQKIRRAG